MAAVALVVLLAALALFQLALALGAPLGHLAWGGQQRVLASGRRLGSLAAIAIYGVIAAVVLDRAGHLDVLPDRVASVGTWVVAVYLGLGVVMNAASRSRPERLVMTPVAAAAAVLTLAVALG